MDELERMKRWRLILGAESRERFAVINQGDEAELSEEQILMDQALAAIYNRRESGGFGSGRGAFQSPDYQMAGRCAHLV